MALKLPDSAVPMGDFPVAKAVDIDFNDGENLQEKLDNGKLGGGGNTTDLTDINTKLTQLETKQINRTNRVDMNSTPVCYKITPKDNNAFSKILIVDLYGGCVLITGSMIPDYKSLKAVRLSNGCWESYSPSNNTGNKIDSVYYDGSYIYVNCLNYIKINFEGGFTNVEKIDSVPTEATRLPILDLTQEADLTDLQEQIDNLDIPDITDLENRVTTNETNITGLQEQINNLDIPDITDLENRVTTNETNITGLQEQINNLDMPDLTDINTKLTQLETKQINRTNRVDMNSTPVCYKITPKDNNAFSKILIVDLYGGCVLITGSMIPDYKSLKAVRLSNGCWESYSPSNNTGNKIDSVYYDGSYIYVNCLDYIKINFEGGFTNVEKIDSVPTEATRLPILDLTQEADLTVINTKMAQLETQVNDLFQSVSSGKTLVANAITDKGVSTATAATFATMATNISKINGYKEETKSYNNTSSGATRLVFTFSADVYGVKQVTPPSDASSHIVPETLTNMFTVDGKKLTLYVYGVGTWEVTAIVRNA